MTREEWLEKAVEALIPRFKEAGYDVPNVKVSCGWPVTGGLNRKTLGECWQGACTPDGTRMIFISPLVIEGSEVLGVLLHELLHACLPDDAKHGYEFKRGMKKVGLTGKPKYALPDDATNVMLGAIHTVLGPYPQPDFAPLPKLKKKRKKTTFKLFCPEGAKHNENSDDPYSVKAKFTSLQFGFPKCPCGLKLEIGPEDQEDYEKLIEDEQRRAALRELAAYDQELGI